MTVYLRVVWACMFAGQDLEDQILLPVCETILTFGAYGLLLFLRSQVVTEGAPPDRTLRIYPFRAQLWLFKDAVVVNTLKKKVK